MEATNYQVRYEVSLNGRLIPLLDEFATRLAAVMHVHLLESEGVAKNITLTECE